jgi:methionyl-tRNA synthetase
MSKRFVSAGWPYLYDVPALHNCVPMIFGDVMARYYRLAGDEVYFLCGADEHGARIEYVAEGQGRTPAAVVDDALARTEPLFAPLSLSFDKFGRTADPAHVSFVRDFMARLRARGAIVPRDVEVAWCDRCARVLPDRFVEGACPACGAKAFGNQCQDKMVCGKMLRPAELVRPRCAVCNDPSTTRRKAHWAMPLAPWIEPALSALTSSSPFRDEVLAVARRVVEETREVIVTRDFRYGVPIELPDGSPGVVDGWVDALLAKPSFAGERFFADSSAEKLFFLGRDGLPFYTVLLPALLAAADRGYSPARWHVQPNQVFVDEGGICSKSTGTGIWLPEALATLPGELWRFYVLYAYAARAEEKDVLFRWERFAEVTNQELIAPFEAAIARVAGAFSVGTAAAWRDDHAAYGLAKQGAAIASDARRLLGELRIGRALFALLAWPQLTESVHDATTAAGAREAARMVLPLFACYAPELARRAWTRLGLRGGPLDPRVADGSHVDDPHPAPRGEPIFPGGEIRAREAQREYQRRVEERRRERSLDEEITAARADRLCACPSELSEG